MVGALVTLCIEVADQPVYVHNWPASLWSEDVARTDSASLRRLIKVEVDSFFSRSGVFYAFKAPNGEWTRDFQTPYAPIAYSLKQNQFREAHHMRMGMTLPGFAHGQGGLDEPSPLECDSLLRAPVDTQAVRAVVDRMAQERTLAFAYHVSGEVWARIAWDRRSSRFLLVRE